MSIYKKIFGKWAVERDEPRSHVNRAPRVQLHPLHRVVFHQDGQENPLELANISAGGMAVFHRDEPTLKVGGLLKGSIRIEKDEFAIEARIRHIIGVLAGCQFGAIAKEGAQDEEFARLKRTVENYFRLEVLALNLYPVSAAFMKPDPRGATHWVTDGRQNEVFCVTDARGVVSFHLSFLGHYVEGTRGAGLQVGLIHEKLSSERPAHKASAMLDLTRAPKPETVRLALSFTQNSLRLPAEVRKGIEDFLGLELAAMSESQSG